MPNKNNEKERKKSYNKIIMKIEEANFTPLVTTKLRENFAAQLETLSQLKKLRKLQAIPLFPMLFYKRSTDINGSFRYLESFLERRLHFLMEGGSFFSGVSFFLGGGYGGIGFDEGGSKSFMGWGGFPMLHPLGTYCSRRNPGSSINK